VYEPCDLILTHARSLHASNQIMAFIVNQHNQRFAYIALIVLSTLGQCAEWCKFVPTGVWGEVARCRGC
jgi:hypothetical protein